MRCCDRLSKAAHWASKASGCCCTTNGCVGDCQLLAPLKVTLPLGGCGTMAFDTGGRGGLPKGLYALWVSKWLNGGVEKGDD